MPQRKTTQRKTTQRPSPAVEARRGVAERERAPEAAHTQAERGRSAPGQLDPAHSNPAQVVATEAQRVLGNTLVNAALAGPGGLSGPGPDGAALDGAGFNGAGIDGAGLDGADLNTAALDAAAFNASVLGDLTTAAAGIDLGGLGAGSNQVMLRRFKAHQAGAQAVDIALSGEGSPLPEAVRLRMEAALGHGLSHVRVHRGGEASLAARAVDALAFTVGADVVFGAGQWQPGTPAGERLLLHELTHVVQHDEGRVPSAQGLELSQPSDALEREAVRAEQRLGPKLREIVSDEELADWAGLSELGLSWGSSNGDAAQGQSDHAPASEQGAASEHAPAAQQASATPSAPLALRAPTPQAAAATPAWRVVSDPELQVTAVGATLRYAVAKPASIQAPGSHWGYRWWCYNDPELVRSQGVPARIDGPDTPAWDATWDLPGEHVLVCQVIHVSASGERGEPLYLERPQRVLPLQQLAAEAFDDATQAEPLSHRAQLELQHLELSQGGVQEQAYGGASIQASGPNPAVAAPAPGFARHSYRVQPSASAQPGGAAARYRWTVHVSSGAALPTESFFGLRRVAGQDAYLLGEGLSATLPIASPGVYTLLCEALNAEGQPLGEVARYRQVVLSEEAAEQVGEWRAFMARCDEELASLDPSRRVGLRAAWVGSERGAQASLTLFIGTSASAPDTWVLLDLTPGAARIRYSGSSVDDAVSDFNDGNGYPQGLIELEVPENTLGVPTLRRALQTTGASTWAEWADAAGWASLGLAAAGVGAALVPGGQGVAAAFFVAAAGVGAGSSGLSLYDQLQQAQVSATRVSLDVLGLATSFMGGGAAVRGLRGGAALTLANRTGRFLLYGSLAGDGASTALIAAESVDQVEAILASEDSDADKVAALVRLLVNMALTGALLAVGLHDLRAARARLQALTGVGEALPEHALHPLSLLDDDALAALRGASAEELTAVAALATLEPITANRLLRLEGRALLEHRIEGIEGGLLRINGELDIHPAKIAQITDPDLQAILLATRAGDRDAMEVFARSGTYRLRFRWQLEKSDDFINAALERLGLAGTPQAKELFGEMTDGERTRLFDLANRRYLKGVKVPVIDRATRYGLGQTPSSVMAFVEEFEMFCSEFERVCLELRDRINAATAAESPSSMSKQALELEIKARPDFLGQAVPGYGASYNQRVLDLIEDAQVQERATQLAKSIDGRVGHHLIGRQHSDTQIVDSITDLPMILFESTSATVYHVNKHSSDLPLQHQNRTGDPVSDYLDSATETVHQGRHRVVRAQDGSADIHFTRAYSEGDKVARMTAIVHVDLNGRAILATYGGSRQ